jgi:formylglycine-generating enzyme required for sulfatase activity
MDFRLFNVGIFSFVLTFILPTQIYAEEEITQHQTLAGEFVKIPGGELNIYGKSVTIESFEMGKYEVTQAQWQEVMGNNPSFFKNCDRCPVENVTWSEVHSFIQKINAKMEANYRLPTIMEWEHACINGGDGEQCKGTNLNAYSSGYMGGRNKMNPVGQKPPNKFGLYNISDNAWEWTCSKYSERYNGNDLVCEEANKKTIRAIRGGKKVSLNRQVLNGVSNIIMSVSFRNLNTGFRLVVIK